MFLNGTMDCKNLIVEHLIHQNKFIIKHHAQRKKLHLRGYFYKMIFYTHFENIKETSHLNFIRN